MRSTSRSWPTITRLTSNITRSRAVASAAGVWVGGAVTAQSRGFSSAAVARALGTMFTVRDGRGYGA